MRKVIFLLPLLALSILPFITHQANAISLDPLPFEITFKNNTGTFTQNYHLVQNSTGIYYESQSGSYFFNSNTCALTKYPAGIINGHADFTDAYSVLASNTANGTSGWNSVGVINNASCVPFAKSNGNDVYFGATKTVVGGGSFTINYSKPFNQDLKLTFSATNNNPAWTNYHLGIRELIQGINQTVTLGSTTFDLSQHNNTGLNRAWISSNNAQLLQLDSKSRYSMGLAWGNANSITDIYHAGNPALQIDYTYNTPILSPGQTITIDPSITSDTSATCNTDAATTCAITIGNNSNRVLIVNLSDAGPANYYASSVKIGSTAFTHLYNKRGGGSGTNTNTEVWYLTQTAGLGTGSQTVTITWTSAPQQSDIGLISLYNVDQTTALSNSTVTSIGGAELNTYSLSITPANTGSWIASIITNQGHGVASPNHTSLWNIASIPDSLFSAAQYYSSPTIGSGNAFTWTGTASSTLGYSMIDYEILQKIGISPSTPTLTHANTLNSTAIKLDWPSVTGATYYLINYTSPATGSNWTQINQTAITKTINGLTAGTQYAFKIAAGNATGSSFFTQIKSNYTKNIAATSPNITVYSNSTARLTVTNPSGNFSGYLIYKATPNSGVYSLAATTSNTTNHYDFSSLLGNTQYVIKASTRYAVGTNSSGVSSNSTTVSFYTLPGAPNALSTIQQSPLHIRLNWQAMNDNGTVTGYKVEQFFSTWTTLSANTGNTTTHYDTTLSVPGAYSFRVSTIKYGGTSVPTVLGPLTFATTLTVNGYHADGITPVYGGVFQTNTTSKTYTNFFPFTSGVAHVAGVLNLNNFTFYNSLINFIVGNQFNYNTTSNHSLNYSTNDFNVDCPYTGVGKDLELFTNGTNGHRISFFSTPICYSNNTMNWKTVFVPNGNDPHSYSTVVYVKVLNSTFLNNATLKWNSTKVATALSNPYLISAYVPVGTGVTGTKAFYWSMNVTINPLFVPANFTVGHISISGTNHLVVPIQLTVTPVSSTVTTVTAVYPTGYNMVYSAQLNSEQKTINYTNVAASIDTPALGESTSVFTYQFPANDTIVFTARDTISNQSSTTTVNQPISSIPLVSQIVLWKTGAYGTTGMFGPVDLVTFLVIIFAFIGMNRVNETIGVVLGAMVIFVAGFFQLVSYPSIFISAIILSILITVASTKKLPWS